MAPMDGPMMLCCTSRAAHFYLILNTFLDAPKDDQFRAEERETKSHS